MKTNQEMVRRMGKFNVTQRTKDGFFNATELLKQWNESVILNREISPYLSQKELKEFFSNKGTRQFIEALMEEENLNAQNPAYIKSRGKNGGTWMHPILFIKFAMWLNPRFEVQVIKFVHDQMIRYRNDAGDAYRRLSSAISTIVPKNEMKQRMKKVGEALNWIVFRKHEKMLRNQYGEEEKQRELWEFEKKVADLIDEGFITNFDNLLAYLRRTYHKASTTNVFYQLR